MLASTLACTIAAYAPVNYSLLYVPQRLSVNSLYCYIAILLTQRLPRLTLAQLRTFWSTTGNGGACCRDFAKFPSPRGRLTCVRLLQGGGVFAEGFFSGTVTFSSCTISGNQAYRVRAHAQKCPSPPWEPHDWRVVLQGGGVYANDGSTFSIVNSQVFSNQATQVRAHVQKFPMPSWDALLL